MFNNEKFFWSPAARWEKKDGQVKIEVFCYKDYIVELFPEFYFFTQKGVYVNDLIDKFPKYDKDRLKNFIQDLIRKKILVDSPLIPHELFYSGNYLFQNKHSENIKYDKLEFENFKSMQLNRNYKTPKGLKINLYSDEQYPYCISERKTCRSFNTNEIISFEVFSKLIAVFRQRRINGQIKYYYASAGGLYPIDIYIYIKEKRIENLKQGLYYYSPLDNSINIVDECCHVNKNAHYFMNQSIFNQSAFSIFFIYNMEVTMPKYGGIGYLYSCIDIGIMVSSLTFVAGLYNIGLCSIGDMNFHKIEKYFQLNKNQVYIHTVELGLKLED